MDPSEKLKESIAKLSKLNETLNRKRIIKKLDYYQPHKFQEAFHQSTAYCRIFRAGNRCLGAEQKIYDPVKKREIPVSEIESDFHVFAWDGEKLVVAKALKPYRKPSQDLYKITLSNGSTLVSSLSHRILTNDGWHDIGTLRLASSFCLPLSILDIDPSTHGEDDRSFLRKAQGFQFDYQSLSHSYDAQLLAESNTDLNAFPSQDDALEHSHQTYGHSSFDGDDQESKPGHSHPYQSVDPLSSPYVQGRFEAQSGGSLSHTASKSCTATCQRSYSHTAPQSSRESCHPKSKYVPDQSENSNPFFESSELPPVLKVTDWDMLRYDEVWDFEVPGFHNYYAAGMIHHNSGKTYALVAEAISYCRGERTWDKTKTKRPPNKVLIGIEDFTHTAVTSVGDLIEAFVNPEEIVERKTIHSGIVATWIFANGSILTLYSYKQEKGSVEGSDWDFVGFNEPPPKWFYTGVTRGLIDRGGRIAFAATLISEPWIFDEICSRVGKDPDYWEIECATDDNPTLGKKEIERFFASMSPEEIQARRFGKPIYMQGRIFPTYSPNTHLVPRETFFQRLYAQRIKDPGNVFNDWDSWPKGMAMDPANVRPSAIIWFAVSPKGEYIIYDEWPNESYYRIRQTYSLNQMVDVIAEKEKDMKNVVWRLIDPKFGSTASIRTGQTLIEDFAQFGLIFDKEFSQDIDFGILRVRNRLDTTAEKEPSLYVLSNCINTHDSMMRWSYEADTQKPKEEWKDFCDTVRYTCAYEPYWIDEKEEQAREARIEARVRSSRIY